MFAKLKNKVNENWTIQEIMDKHPRGEKVILENVGSSCFACTQSLSNKLSDCVNEHGIDPQKILKDLNRAFK